MPATAAQRRAAYVRRVQAERSAELARTTEQPGEVLDFEIAPIGQRFGWGVFDARTQATAGNVAEGMAATADAARLAALTFIARRNVSRCHVLRDRSAWLIFLPLLDAFAPLPLTAAASFDEVHAHVARLPIAAGRPVVITNA